MSTSVQVQSTLAEPSNGSPRRSNRPRGDNKHANRRARPNNRTKDPKSTDPTTQENTEKVEEPKQSTDVTAPALSDTGSMDVCWICAEPVKYSAVSECNHRTCHVCALRLRALYKKMECTFCKENQNLVIFTASSDTPFASFNPENIPHKDAKLSIYFETQEMMEESLLLLRFNCPDPDCDYMGNGWGDLRLHARASHGKFMCDLCIRSKKVFCHEHILYPPGTLPVHLPSMNARPSKTALKEPVEGGVHPICAFCRECFFGDDELYAHMRDRHEECFICKRNGIVHEYFANYDSLEKHFNTTHHPCPQPDCLARKFVVFDAPIDLKAHMVETHGADMSSKDKKDARRISTDFTFESIEGNRHGRRDRERDRELQDQHQQIDTPSLSNGPGRPTPSRRRDAFGGALTEPKAGTTSNHAGRENRPSSPDPNELDPATAEKQTALLSRLASLSLNPSSAVPAVRAATRSYRLAESNARDLILTIWNVMDRHLEHTASIVNALVDLVDDEEKKNDILSSWKGFVVEQKRLSPELIPTSIGSEYAGIASGRVLSAKHATSARSSQSVWNRVAMAASSSNSSHLPPPKAQERFPPLRASSSSNAVSLQPGQRSTPWSAASMAPSPLRASSTNNITSTPTSRPSTTKRRVPPPKLSNAQFPELPTLSSARTKLHVSGNVSLMNIMGGSGPPAVSPWGGNAASGAVTPPDRESAAQAPSSDDASPPMPAKNKKKGKQKQTLFTLGSFPA